VSYVRLTPEEFQAIRQTCDPVDLSGDFLAVFKYFLVEALTDKLPELAARILRLRKAQIVLLYGFLKRQRMSAAKSRGRSSCERGGYGLTSEELQTIRRASGPFFLQDGYLGSFQDYLMYNLRESRPGLAAKLADLRPRQIARLYQQTKRRSRWN
jgi:hypothetical protein